MALPPRPRRAALRERYDRREMVRRIETLTREDLLVQAVRRAVGGTCGTVTAAAAGSVA